MRISRNVVFFKFQNTHKVGTLCTLLFKTTFLFIFEKISFTLLFGPRLVLRTLEYLFTVVKNKQLERDFQFIICKFASRKDFFIEKN